MIKKKLLLALLIFSACFLSAEEKKHDVFSSKNPVIEKFEVTPNPVGKGDLFTMTISLDYDSSSEVDFPLKNLPEDLLLWRGPYIRSFVDTDKDGNSVRKVRITTTFKALNSGRMIIPALSVIVDGKELNTEPHLLKVGLYKSRKLYMPLEVEWQLNFDKIYAGEAVPVSLMVMNQEVVAIFEKVRVAYPRDGFFEEAGGIAEIRSITEGGITLYDIPAATYLMTSPSAGEIKIPSAGVDYEGITGWTDNLFLKINRIPEEIKESGAIGDFFFTVSIDKEEAAAGENIALTISVQGEGNLNYLKLPEPSAEGCILVSSEEYDDYIPSPLGFSGSKAVRWLFTADKQGVSEFIIPEFTYLQKSSDRLETYKSRVYNVKINEAAVKLSDTELKKFPFVKVDTDKRTAPVWKNYYHNLYRYAWLLPGLIFFLLAVIMKGKRLPMAAVLSVIILIAVYSTGRFTINFDSDTDNSVRADLLYNLSLDAYLEGNLTDSLHSLRTAVYYDPVNSLYRDTLDWIETENGFVNSVSPSIGLHPDIFYYILMASINMLFFAAVLKLVRPGGGVSVLLILFVFFIVFSSVMIFYSHTVRERMTAVVCPDGSSLKKIPRETAENWVPLEAGTALKILDESDEFLLVETGLGVKGWITGACIIQDR